MTGLPRPTAAALTRFRVLAWVVGVMLLVLVGIAMPVKYVGDDDSLVAAVSPVHGLLYIVYLVATLDLARRVGWSARYSVLVMLGGTVPFLSFVLERRVARRLTAPDAAPARPDPVPSA